MEQIFARDYPYSRRPAGRAKPKVRRDRSARRVSLRSLLKVRLSS